MIVSEMINVLRSLPQNASLVCGEKILTMWMVSNFRDEEASLPPYLDGMFIGVNGSPPVFIKMGKEINLSDVQGAKHE